MATITLSGFKGKTTQADGSFNVVERHLDSDGKVYEFSYNADASTNLDLVLASRAKRINSALADKATAESVAFHGELPISKLDFLARFTSDERIAVRTAAKTDGVVEDFMELLKITDVIHPNHAMAQQGLAYLTSIGVLTSERAELIGAA